VPAKSAAPVKVAAPVAPAKPPASASPPPAPAPAPAPAPVARPSGTFTGTAVQTYYGNVQVSVSIQNGTITNVTALHLTNLNSYSVAVSSNAAPILRSEVLAAQSARVSSVSGATYTSYGYLTSLQSALDRARF
jgi:uncharacterized protein with FMN-binding domain